jgi:biopolymer transport protein ExbB/TolQ
MIAYRFFRSKIDNYLNEMEHYAIQIVEILKG